MTTTLTPDETPKKQVAKKVITAKRRYFFPQHSLSVEATSLSEAQDIMSKQLTQEKAGDE